MAVFGDECAWVGFIGDERGPNDFSHRFMLFLSLDSGSACMPNDAYGLFSSAHPVLEVILMAIAHHVKKI